MYLHCIYLRKLNYVSMSVGLCFTSRKFVYGYCFIQLAVKMECEFRKSIDFRFHFLSFLQFLPFSFSSFYSIFVRFSSSYFLVFLPYSSISQLIDWLLSYHYIILYYTRESFHYGCWLSFQYSGRENVSKTIVNATI